MIFGQGVRAGFEREWKTVERRGRMPGIILTTLDDMNAL